MKQSDQYSPKETEQRLRALLRGAFAGPPTQLKDIPTRSGKPRKAKKASRAAASAKSARRAT